MTRDNHVHAIIILAVTVAAGSFASGCARVHSTLADDETALLTAPSEYVGEMPADADVTVRRARVMPVSAECAWDVITDIEGWPRWYSDSTDAKFVEGSTAFGEGEVFLQTLNGDMTFRAEILASERGRIARWRGIAPDGSGPSGFHTFTFVPRDDGTTLVINDEHFHAWYIRPLGWATDLGIGDKFDKQLEELEREAVARCGSGSVAAQ